MVESVLANAGPVGYFPFPQVVIHDCLPKPLFDELDRTFPEDAILRQPHEGEGVRVDLHTRDALKELDGAWLEFIQYHTSQAFWREVAHLFADAIYLMYPLLHIKYGPYLEWDCGPRRVEQSTLQMECQPGVNTPQNVTQRVRGPHIDNPVELYGALLYMGDGDDGELEIQRLIKPPRFHGKLEIKDKCVETVSRVPYRKNTMVMFINGPTSIHAVTPRGPSDKCRRLVNLVGEVREPLFKVGYGGY
jgi:hypothetical protein